MKNTIAQRRIVSVIKNLRELASSFSFSQNKWCPLPIILSNCFINYSLCTVTNQRVTMVFLLCLSIKKLMLILIMLLGSNFSDSLLFFLTDSPCWRSVYTTPSLNIGHLRFFLVPFYKTPFKFQTTLIISLSTYP